MSPDLLAASLSDMAERGEAMQFLSKAFPTAKTVDALVAGNKENNNFDFLRFLAAVCVIYSHSFPLGAKLPDPKMPFFDNSVGGFGVYLFFILSGFLVTHSFMSSKTPVSFFAKRLLRIFPALIVVMAVSAFVLGPLVSNLSVHAYFSSHETYAYLKGCALFWGNGRLPGVFCGNIFPFAINGSLWTLPFELACYVFLAVIGFAGIISRKKFNLQALLLTVVLALVMAHNLDSRKLMGFACFFAAGMLFYVCREFIPLSYKLLGPCLALLVVKSLLPVSVPEEALSILLAYVVLYTAALDAYPLKHFGKYGDFSYGMYIYAFPVQQAIVFFIGKTNPYSMFAISFIATLVFAALSWHFVEKRCMAAKKYFQ